MLATIHFDRKAGRHAGEVHNIFSNLNLSAKPIAINLLAPKPRPKPDLGLGRVGSQAAYEG